MRREFSEIVHFPKRYAMNVKEREARGLKCESICTDITADAVGVPGVSAGAEKTLRVAADCGIHSFRPAYYFYDEKAESFRQSMERIRGGLVWDVDPLYIVHFEYDFDKTNLPKTGILSTAKSLNKLSVSAACG